MSRDSKDVLERIERDKEAYLEELKDFIRIPSISADPRYRDDVLRCSEFIADNMKSAGLEVESLDTARNPLIYGEWSGAPEKPTLLFYGHYDVQPVDPIEEWRHEPFEPTEEGDLLVGRGATDDKGQVFTQVKAVQAILEERGELPVNVKFLLEGEEEVGGESIERFVREDAGRRLRCDAVIISDTSMFAPGQPSLLYGLKGLAYTEVVVRGPNRDLHSGSFGGAVRNPANALCEIVSRLVDPESGKILIPGFYDDVRPLEEWEREAFGKLTFDEEEYAADLGLETLFGEDGYSTLERTWARPTCDVNGLYGGYQGDGAKTILPALAGAKVSMRLVPDQHPRKIGRLFREYVEKIAHADMRVEVSELHGAQPVLIDIKGPIAEAAMAAQEEIWGNAPVLVREGGSIPIVATFAEVLEVPILLVGFGLPDDRLHSPNEKFNISHFYNGIRTITRILDRVGEVPGS
jgi:acetylornithine deacetylase/succinyl-diaminopimelate desuccinylase-like protein